MAGAQAGPQCPSATGLNIGLVPTALIPVQGMRSETAMPRRSTATIAIKDDNRRAFLQVNPGVVGLAGLEPAASSEMDGRALCYPAFALVVRLRKSYKDGVNSLSAAERQAVRGRGWSRPSGPAIDDDPSAMDWVDRGCDVPPGLTVLSSAPTAAPAHHPAARRATVCR
jgi:hypothetical protein